MDAAAIVAEDEQIIGEGEKHPEIRDGADEGGQHQPEEENFDEARIGSVIDGDDADAEDAFADGLAAGHEHPQLHGEEGERGETEDREASADAGDGGEAFEPTAEFVVEAGADGGEGDHKGPGQNAGEADHVIEELSKETIAPIGQGTRFDGRGGAWGERSGKRVGRGRRWLGQWWGFGGAKLHEVAEAAPFLGADGLGLRVEIGAAGGQPFADLVGGGGTVFFAVASDDGKHAEDEKVRQAGRQRRGLA